MSHRVAKRKRQNIKHDWVKELRELARKYQEDLRWFNELYEEMCKRCA